MFVLVSKKAAAKAPPPSTAPAAQSSTRTQNACDACRIRKAKCDGQIPCGRCRMRQLVCTSSRRHLKASGPVTEEHVATLQEQQRRLTRAVSRMAYILKEAESRGFVLDQEDSGGQELSPIELAETLQRFAPEEAANSPSMDESTLPSKKRKLQPNLSLVKEMDVAMDDPLPTNTKNYQPFEKFFATVQQHNHNSQDMAPIVAQQARSSINPQSVQPLQAVNAQNMAFAAPVESASFDFHPQLAPFVDMVDWDASLEHFLDAQYDEGSFDWNLGNGGFDVDDGKL